MKKKICQYLSKVLVEMPEEELMKTMEIPPKEKMGDLALPCFAMAKKMRKNPMRIATELVEKLNEQKDELGIEKVESVGAYCNIHLKRDLLRKALSLCKKTSMEYRRLVAEKQCVWTIHRQILQRIFM